jgi:hypothetical protein
MVDGPFGMYWEAVVLAVIMGLFIMAAFMAIGVGSDSEDE